MKPSPSPSLSPWVREVSEATFQADVLDASEAVPVVVDFWSPGCAPCRTLGPLLERLTHERQGQVLLAKVNTDHNPRLAEYFGITAIPAIKVIYRGQLVHEFEGLLPEPALRQFFDEIAGPSGEGDPAVLKAQAAEEAAPARAEKLYREMIAREPDKQEARVGLARVLLRLGRLDEIAEVLEPVGTSGELGAEVESIQARAWLLKNAEALPDEKELRQKVAADPANAQARLELGGRLAARGAYDEALGLLYAAAERDFKLAQGKAREVMVKVFYALGSNHPLANDYRSRLARLLY
jgi:putative thioredoxin